MGIIAQDPSDREAIFKESIPEGAVSGGTQTGQHAVPCSFSISHMGGLYGGEGDALKWDISIMPACLVAWLSTPSTHAYLSGLFLCDTAVVNGEACAC